MASVVYKWAHEMWAVRWQEFLKAHDRLAEVPEPTRTQLAAQWAIQAIPRTIPR